MFIRVYDCYDNEWAVINTDRIEKIHPYGDDKKQHIVVMTSESVVVDEATVEWIADELGVRGADSPACGTETVVMRKTEGKKDEA